MKHLGIDLSPEGTAARNRMGISVIISGAPFSGKTTIANQISQHYGAVVLTIDDIIMEAIINGTSRASKSARELCQEETSKKQHEPNIHPDLLESNLETPTTRDDAVSVRTNLTKSIKSNTGSKSSGQRGLKAQNSLNETAIAGPMLPQRTGKNSYSSKSEKVHLN